MTDRDQALDVFKGLLVACMVYCHVLQFFGDATLFPAVGTLETLINLTVFPGFVFAFGCALSIAYLPKPFARVWPRMLRAAIKPLGAFYLSGIAFRVLRENKPFAADTVRRILLLQDIPGWSEFLLAFSLYGFLAMILFRPLRSLRGRPLVAAGLGALCLAACFLPYGHIRGSYAGLLIGTRDMVTFPVLQYAPYFLMGLVFPEYGRRYAKRWALGAAACATLGIAIAWLSGGIPERFPPSLGWILLSAGGGALLLTLSHLLCGFGGQAWFHPRVPLASMGRNSLFYLLASNGAIFTLAGKNLAPWLKRNAGLWSLPIQSPLGALCWSGALLLVCGFVAWLISGRSGRAAPDRPTLPG